MDETDALLFCLALGALSLAIVLLAGRVRSLEADLDLLRITAAVPAVKET
jgi:hypothetical protein